jgi:large subunit ribosomal protein L21
MKSAVIALDGKQFIVQEGTVLKVNSIENLDNLQVLAYKDEEMNDFGSPFLNHILVKLEKIEDRLDEKLRVARFRSKSRYRKTKGFRQPISILKVVFIEDTSSKGKADTK